MRPIRNRLAKIVAIGVLALTLFAASSSPGLAWGGLEPAGGILDRLQSVDDGGVIGP